MGPNCSTETEAPTAARIDRPVAPTAIPIISSVICSLPSSDGVNAQAFENLGGSFSILGWYRQREIPDKGSANCTLYSDR